MKDFISAKNETRIERRRKGEASKATPAAKRGGARQGRTPSSPASRVWRLAALVLCAGVVGGGAWRWMFVQQQAPQNLPLSNEGIAYPTEKPKSSKSQQMTVLSTTPTSVGTNASSVAVPMAVGDPYGGTWRGQKIVSYTVKTNGWSTYERIVTEDGRRHGIIGSTVKPIFDNGSDQMLAIAVRAARDSATPPMPLSPAIESDFLESLKKPIVINDDDNEEVRRIKRDVMQAREDMIDLMNKGMTVQQALEEHFRLANENVSARNKAVEELRALVDAGDAEGAAKYVEAVNPILEKMGAMRLELPEERWREHKPRRSDIEKR